MDIVDVDGETIERAGFKDKDFERFVKRLLLAEHGLRHRPDAEVQGPVANYLGDDKRDLVFVVHGPPTRARTEFTAALTWDDPGSTWYSCKGGGGWRDAILKELGRQAYNEFDKKRKRPGPKVQKRPPAKLLDHIERGGRYVFVIAAAAIDDRDLLDQVAQQLSFWLEHDGRVVPPELREQLEFIDANRLAHFVGTHKPELTEEQRLALGLDEPTGLKSWAQWTDEIGAGRDLPDFEADAAREALFQAIADPSIRVLRVFGPPGVGKTRVVHEAIRRCSDDAQERTRYSDDIDVNLQVVQLSWLRRGSRPWLVLDELRSVDVDEVIAKFQANASEGARLILVGTSDGGTREVPWEYPVSELEETQARRLIRSEASTLPEAQIEAIWHLSEGYPWYAVLLARAVATDEQILEHGDDDATRWHRGTKRVLAGNPRDYGDDVSKWEREAELRAKTLLVAMLTRDVELEWEELCERHGDGLRLAIGEPSSWDEVVRREQVCRQRQLLRQSGVRATRRYVSPNNLARLILHHFLTDPDLGPKIRRHAPRFRGTLVAIAKAVRVNPALVDGLARGEWEELERRACHEELETVEAYLRDDEPTYQAARDAPELAARTMARIVTSMGIEALGAGENLRVVARFVFAHVIHRKISIEAFRAVERALLRLARLDDSAFTNGARGIWMSLFQPGLHSTHQSWELRLELLDERLADNDVLVRGLAIDALEGAIEPWERGLGHNEHDKADGDWPLPTMDELRERKAELWERLLGACEDGELAVRAQSIVADQIRGGIGRGLLEDGLARLTSQVRAWNPAQRRQLLEKIADIHRYDLASYADQPELFDALGELEQAAAPIDLPDRVRAQFGTWRPGPWPINDPERATHEAAADLELARALLDDPESLDWTIEWSTGPEPRRARALWTALGQTDCGRGLHERLAGAVGLVSRPGDRAGNGFPAVDLAAYLWGWAGVGGVEIVEQWIGGKVTGNPSLASSALWFLVTQTPTGERLDHIRKLVEIGAIVPEALDQLVFRDWAQQLEIQPILDFATFIADFGALTEVALRLTLASLERELDAGQREAALEFLGRLFGRCLEGRAAIGVQHALTEAGLRLVEAGRLQLVSELIIEALAVKADGHSNIRLGHQLLAELLRKGHGEVLWSLLAETLVGRDSSLLSRQLANERLLAGVPASAAMSWIGEDRRRAKVVAGLTNPHDEQLDPIARELLLRFGAEGEIGSRLRSRALSTPGMVAGGLVAFERRQREHARAWQLDDSPAVKAWAQEIEMILTRRIDEHEARAELRLKYG